MGRRRRGGFAESVFVASLCLMTLLTGLVVASNEPGFTDVYSAIKTLTGSRTRSPFFDPSSPTKVTVASDTTAVLSCKVHFVGNFTVSWLRHKDLHIFSAGLLKYTSDSRYDIMHRPRGSTSEYQLRINYVQQKDAGVYECQISTNPISTFYVRLKVTPGDGSIQNRTEEDEDATEEETLTLPEGDSTTEILGGYSIPGENGVREHDIYVRIGDMVNLTCVISGTNDSPKEIFWYHDGKVISYYSDRGGVSIVTVKGEVTVSQLLIKGATVKDQGSYRCDPSNTAEATTRVFVLDDVEYLEREALAAKLASTSSKISFCDTLKFTTVLIYLLSLIYNNL